MRSSRIWLIVAGILLVIGAVLVTTSTGDSVGWFAYAPESDSIGATSFYLLTTTQVVGWGAAWLASLIVTGVVVHRLVVRRLSSQGHKSG